MARTQVWLGMVVLAALGWTAGYAIAHLSSDDCVTTTTSTLTGDETVTVEHTECS